MASEPGDLLLFVADHPSVVARALGALRLEMAKRLSLIEKDNWKPVWITEFPLLEYDGEEDRMVAIHHPFTSPLEEDVDLLQSAPQKARARAHRSARPKNRQKHRAPIATAASMSERRRRRRRRVCRLSAPR